MISIVIICCLAVFGLGVLYLIIYPPPYLREKVRQATIKYRCGLRYRYLLSQRWRFLPSPLTFEHVLLHAMYVGINVFCLLFRTSSVAEAGLRAGKQSLVNLMPVYFGLHLDFLADVFGVRLETYRQVHRSAGSLAVILLLLHVAVQLLPSAASFPLARPRNRDGFMAFVAVLAIFVATLARILLRRWGYEFFLRVHQALAIITAYGIWGHLPASADFFKYFLGVCFGWAALMLTIQSFLYVKNNSWPHRPEVLIYRDRESEATVLIIQLPFPLKIKAGQHVNIWIYDIAKFSSHPFLVTSWSADAQKQLKLLIQSRNGFTSLLFDKAKEDVPPIPSLREMRDADKTLLNEKVAILTEEEDTEKTRLNERVAILAEKEDVGKGLLNKTIAILTQEEGEEVDQEERDRQDVVSHTIREEIFNGDSCLRAYISGPHGISVPVHQYQDILMFATDFGLAAHLPYLKKVIESKAATSRIYLVWQLYDERLFDLFNDRFRDLLDRDSRKIFQISVHCRTLLPLAKGNHRTELINECDVNAATYIKSHQGGRDSLVMVSSYVHMRVDVRKALRDDLQMREADLEELDYQPPDPFDFSRDKNRATV